MQWGCGYRFVFGMVSIRRRMCDAHRHFTCTVFSEIYLSLNLHISKQNTHTHKCKFLSTIFRHLECRQEQLQGFFEYTEIIHTKEEVRLKPTTPASLRYATHSTSADPFSYLRPS